MEERDYFKKQIDALGRILGKLLTDLAGKKSPGGITDGIEITNQVLQDQLDLDIKSLIAIPENKTIDLLQFEKGLSNENLEKLAEILMLNLENDTENKIEEANRINLYAKCLAIYEHIQKHESAYSLERNMKIQNIKLLFSN